MTRLSRREVLSGAVGGLAVGGRVMGAQDAPAIRSVETPALTIGYEESGDPRGEVVVLLHGFPDDVRAYDGVAPPLARRGCRVLVPYLRGHGRTRLHPGVPFRGGEQAALAQDLLDFLDRLQVRECTMVGYDWGGRAAGVVAAVQPSRVRGVVLMGGYTIQNVFAPSEPASPQREQALWYQWYFSTERGRAGLAKNRRALCRLLWTSWSPTWKFADAVYESTASSFDNPDFVDVTIHSYRHRHGYADGDPQYLEMERALASRPRITVPSIVLYGADDGVAGPPPVDAAGDRARFSTLIDRRIVAGVGHFMPRERPETVAAAVTQLLDAAGGRRR